MFTNQQKEYISKRVQEVLRETGNDELPDGEISFILHVDGAEDWSWANIRNGAKRAEPVPVILIGNMDIQ